MERESSERDRRRTGDAAAQRPAVDTCNPETQEMECPGSETGFQPMVLLTLDTEEDKKNNCSVIFLSLFLSLTLEMKRKSWSKSTMEGNPWNSDISVPSISTYSNHELVSFFTRTPKGKRFQFWRIESPRERHRTKIFMEALYSPDCPGLLRLS